MIDPFRALGWLNAIDNRSHLINEDRQLIGAISKVGLFDFRIEPIVERLRDAAHSAGNPFRKAEILLCCAAIGHSRGWYPQAARDAKEAVIPYDTDDHRHAVAIWILGIIQWELLQNHEAYRNWDEAKKTFKRCQTSFSRSPNVNDWYKDPIWQMEVDLVARPEEIHTWLNRYERSSLKLPTRQVVNCVRETFRPQTNPNIYDFWQDLQDAKRQSERRYERAEIYLEFGLVAYQIGELQNAIRLLRNAVQYFNPGIGTYHKRAVARCMLGAVEWMDRHSHGQAAADWLRCIVDFENLRGAADRDNFREKEAWYSEHCDILRSALLEWVEPPKQSDLGNGKPKERGSRTTGKR